MKKMHPGLAPVILLLLAAGCAPASRGVAPPEPRPLGRGLATAEFRPEAPPPDRSRLAEPSGPLTLRAALTAALALNPDLDVLFWEVRAREAEATQAALRPNPELGADVENFAGGAGRGGFRRSETTVSVSQRLELGGKRENRRIVADHNRQLAEWDYEVRRLDVLTATTKAFLRVLAVQERLSLADSLVRVDEDLLVSVRERVRAGALSPVEESRARVELEAVRIDRERAAHDLVVARRELSALWGGTAPVFTNALGDLEAIPEPPSLDALRSRVQENPDLARWSAGLELRRAEQRLQRSLGKPDLTLGVGVRYVREAGAATFVAGFGVPIPVFDRNQGAAKAAGMRINRAEAEQSARALELTTRLSVLHETLLAANAEAGALRDRAIPEAVAAFGAARDGYLRGAMRFTDVLDTERLLFELNVRYLDALVRCRSTVADIERLTGAPLRTPVDDERRVSP